MQQQHGSGKTAVLVERIIHKILDENIDIDRLLVVTFTNAAASEMKERVQDAIYKKLDYEPDNQKLQRQITLLNKASICTIDSFCLEIVRNYFYELENVSPNFRIADTTEIEILKQEILEEIFEEKYEEQDEDFSKLINIYTSYRDDSPLKDLILKIYNYIQSTPFPQKWLNDKVEMFNVKDDVEQDFSKTPWGEILLQDLEEELIDCLSILEKAEEDLSYDPELENFSQTIRNDIEMLQNLKHNITNWDKAFEISLNFTFNTWPRKRVDSSIKENAKKMRDNVKKKIGNKIDKILICNSKEANQDILDMYQNLLKLKELIFEFEDKYSKAKREKNIVDFNDIEHFALNILLKQNADGTIEETQVAKMYQEKFEEIAIDEYQDSNEVQEYILSSVARENNRFMVGDVKQSIYKFRQAMPELFLEKYDTYKNKQNQNLQDNLKIQLFKNFRSRKNVLEITNIIFKNIMSNVLGDIEYNEEEYLNLGADYKEEKQDLRTEIDIIDLKGYEENNSKEEKKEEWAENEKENNDEDNEAEERVEDIELEAKFVAKRIKKLIDSKFQVWDRKKESYRNIKYKDIVILLRSTKTTAPIYEQELLNLQMPVFSDSSQEYLDTIEIQTIMSLLKIVDNPMQDIPLVAVLRSPMFNFTDNELIQIRLTDKQDNFYLCMKKAKVDVDNNLRKKIEDFFQALDTWRSEQEYLALDEFIWKIYQDTGYYNYVSLMPNGDLRIANLKMLFERAKQYETASFKGLYNFINFIEKLKSNSGDMGAAKLIGENDDVIRIMSIHKSKGLEFPVVFLSSTGKQFNLRDLNQNLVLHQKLGIGVKYIDYEKQVQYDTLSKTAIKCKLLNETLSEEMRILYVALTRAKEKLIITGLVKDNEKEQLKLQECVETYAKVGKKIPPVLIKKQNSYLDWIRIVYQYEKDSNIKEKIVDKTGDNIDDLVVINIFKKKEIIKSLEEIDSEETDIISELEERSVNNQEQEEIKKIIEYEYPHILSTTIPTKTSVSEIKRFSIEEEGSLEKDIHQNILDMKNKAHEEKTDEEKSYQTNYAKPKFLNNDETEKLTSAQKGTLVHLCLQKLNEKQDYSIDNVKELIQEIQLKEIITKKEAEGINPYKILEFTKSKIWNDLKDAKKIYKEQPFYISMSAREIYNSNVDEEVLVQGIIDLYYIDKDDNIVLVDYKTDYVEDGRENELVQKYQKQLELYREALEEALNKKVDKVYIYSVYLGKEICI